ncbi:MAG: hypothetical protein AB1540_09375 [Bdellovibrionota bacterium]
MSKLISLLILTLAAQASPKTQQSDIAFDRLAHQLELIRNELELTVENRNSLSNDIERQRRESIDFDLFLRIPLETHDIKQDSALLKTIQNDLVKTSAANFKKVQFKGPWKKARSKIPKTIPFHESYKIPDSLLVDSRELTLEISFAKLPEQKPEQWIKNLQPKVRRLLVFTGQNRWNPKSKSQKIRTTIFRFRDIAYPEFQSPDLARFALPHKPQSPHQNASAARIQRYRQEVSRLWPQVQPYLDEVRLFALNDHRMSFYLKHVRFELDAAHRH